MFYDLFVLKAFGFWHIFLLMILLLKKKTCETYFDNINYFKHNQFYI